MNPLEHYHTIVLDEKYQCYPFQTRSSPYLSSRKSLIGLLFTIGRKLRQQESTVYLAIKYLDIILNTDNFMSETAPKEAFKPLALVCLNIASKFDALDLNTPLASELQRASGCSISYNSLLQYEAEWLKLLDWDLKQVTLFHVIDILKYQGVVFSDDTRSGKPIDEDLQSHLTKVTVLLDYFKDMVIREPAFMEFKPTLQAAVCVLATRMCLNIDQPMSNTLSEVLLYTSEDLSDAFKLLDEKFGYLIDAAESTLSTSDLNSCPNRAEKIRNLQKGDELYQKLQNIMKEISNLHDFTDRFIIEKRMWASVYSSNDSAKYSEENLNLNSSSEDGYYYYEESGLKIPYNLDEYDLDLLEESIQQQMRHGHQPLTQIRASSTGPEMRSYKAQISSLLGGKTKGSTSGKENYEDLNNDESPLFDAETGFYNNEKLPFILNEKGQLVMCDPIEFDVCKNEQSSKITEQDDKLAKKREKRKEKKKRRKAKKYAAQQELADTSSPEFVGLEPGFLID